MRPAKLTTVALGLVVLAAACTQGGCNWLAYIGYLFSPADTRTVAPAFSKLDDNTVAIIIVAPDKFVKSYDYFREQLGMVISQELKRHLDDVETVEAFAVVKYQKTNPNWAAVPQSELARILGADYLLVVTVRDYRLRPEGSASLYHGYISADAELFEATGDKANVRVLWSPEISVDYPKGEYPLTQFKGGLEELRFKIDSLFAEALVKQFRYHEVENEREND